MSGACFILSHSTSRFGVVGALHCGGRLVLVPGHIARSAPDFYTLVCKSSATVLNQTPSAFKALIEAERESGVRNQLRYVILEARPWSLPL
ncbi:AMP-binding protein [Sinorhizobium meliloti]|uniref:AMP-binding protein n=1 Tax=Rhizobium meliloti TaxID=382 RepID=UPI003BF95005